MLNTAKVAVSLVLFIVWVALSSVGLFYYGNQHYGNFDANTNWQTSVAGPLNTAALGITAQAGIQVVHVQQGGCICNTVANQHIALFSREYAVPQPRQYHRQAVDIAATGFSVPATPAVLIFNDGALIYAGPYATGPLCSAADSVIAPLLLKQIQLPGVWLNGEAKACRCVVKQAL